MKSLSLVCGVDVSKDTLDLYFNDEGGRECHLKVSNDTKGHQQLLTQLGVERTYLMESSGPYYLRLAFLLKSAGADVRLENPLVVKRFIQMNLERNKSDRKDAKWLFRFALEREATLWTPPTEQGLKCNQLLTLLKLYTRQLTMMDNQLHALAQLPVVSKEVTKSLQATRQQVHKEIKKLEAKLQALLEAWQGQQMQQLSSIPGLGKRAVALLIVYTDGFKKIQNHRQLIALAGLAPREHTSGTSVRGRKGICKMGNGHLRNVLYMCSLSAIKHNGACKALYERLKAKGKGSKVALIAVCNKLLKQAFAIATKGQVYQAGYQSRLAVK